MTLHTQIEQDLLQQIEQGKLKPGDTLLPEVQLAEKYGASRATVRQALATLVSRGYLKRTKGRGSVITTPEKLTQENTRFLSSYRLECKRRGLEIDTKVLAHEVIPCDGAVAGHLGLQPGDLVFRLVRLRSVEDINEGKPVVYTTLYVPMKLFPAIVDQDFRHDSFYDTLDQHNLSVRRVVRTLEVRPIDREISRLLQCSIYAPMFFVSSVGYLADGRAIEYSESIYPSENNQFVAEITR